MDLSAIDPAWIDAAAWAFLMGGAFFLFVGGIGVMRLPDVFTRLHAAGVTDTLGAGLMVVGMCLVAGLTLVTAKLIIILVFLWFTGPISSHALAQSAILSGRKPKLAHNRLSAESAKRFGLENLQTTDAEDNANG